MPTFELSGPGGAAFHVEAPDAQAAFQAFQQFSGGQTASPGAPAATPPSKGVMGYVDDAVRSIANGATFGFADRLAAAGNSALGSGNYDDNLRQEQARDAQIPAAIDIPGQVAGGVASAVIAAPFAAAAAPARLVQLASKLPLAARLGTAGAGFGALSGAGNAPPGEMLQGAATGAPVGAAIGGIGVPLAAKGVSLVTNAIRHGLNPEANAAADLGRALQRDNMTPQQMSENVGALNELRPGVATLADAGGENVRGLLERVANTPGAGRTQVIPALTGRQQQQAGRLASDLRDLTGTTKSAYQTIEDTTAQRAKDAAPLYQHAYEAGDRPIWSPGLETLTASPTIQSAMHGAVRIWQDNAVADGFGAMNPGAMVKNGGMLDFLNGKVPVFPNIQFWDYTKRILDDQISSALRAGENQKARTLTTLAGKLRSELDGQVPEFAQARAAWAGPSRYLDSIELGRDILNPKVGPQEWAAHLGALSHAEQDGVRVGVVSSIIGKMGNDAAKLGDMTKYLRSPNMQQKIASIMPTPEAAQQWLGRLNFEVKSSELTGQALGNSSTARRLAEQEDAKGLVGDLVMDALKHGTTRSVLEKVVLSGPKWLQDKLRSRTDANLADILTKPASLDDLQGFLGKVQARQPQPSSGRTQALVGAGAISGVAPQISRR